MHVHVSVADLLKVFAYVVIAGSFWRILAMRLKDTALGQAMAFIY
jgi:hypothetical protein